MFVKINKKLHSETGASIIYALMLFIVATLVGTLIVSSSLSALKRANAQRDRQQASLLVNGAVNIVKGYLNGGLTYTKADVRVDEVTKVNDVETASVFKSLNHRKEVQVKKVSEDKSVTQLATSYIEYGDTLSPTGSITYEPPATGGYFLPKMFQNGILNGLLYVDTNSAIGLKYESEVNTANDGIIYFSVPDGTVSSTAKKDRVVKITYTIMPNVESEAAPTGDNANNYEIVFKFTVLQNNNGAASTGDYDNYDEMNNATFLIMQAGLKEPEKSTSEKEISKVTDDDGVITTVTEITTTTTQTVTWQKGSVSTVDPLAEKKTE